MVYWPNAFLQAQTSTFDRTQAAVSVFAGNLDEASIAVKAKEGVVVSSRGEARRIGELASGLVGPQAPCDVAKARRDGAQ